MEQDVSCLSLADDVAKVFWKLNARNIDPLSTATRLERFKNLMRPRRNIASPIYVADFCNSIRTERSSASAPEQVCSLTLSLRRRMSLGPLILIH